VNEKGSSQDTLLNAFLDAVDLIARGGSPFVKGRPASSIESEIAGVPTFLRYHSDDGALAQIDTQLPLDCTSSNMVAIDQIALATPALGFTRFINTTQQINFNSTALVPNCTFSALRASGIYSGSRSVASVQEHAIISNTGDDDQVFLTNQGIPLPQQLAGPTSATETFTIPPSAKRLARDRDDWRTGRSLSNFIDGIQIGELSIPFASAVMASGPEAFPDGIENSQGTGIDWDRHYTNGLVAQPLGDCPPRPSGLPSEGMECIVFVRMRCDAFEEDFQIVPLQDPFLSDSNCHIDTASMVWGRGLDIDAALVATMAGLFGRIKPNIFLRQLLDFEINAVLSAKFASASVSVLPRIDQKVSPQIDGLYIFFARLPFSLSVGVMIVAWAVRSSRLPIPTNSWEVLVLGREETEVPTREDRNQDFPAPDRALTLGLVQTDANSKLCIVKNAEFRTQKESTEEAVKISTLHWDESGSTGGVATGNNGVASSSPRLEDNRNNKTHAGNSMDPSGIYQL